MLLMVCKENVNLNGIFNGVVVVSKGARQWSLEWNPGEREILFYLKIQTKQNGKRNQLRVFFFYEKEMNGQFYQVDWTNQRIESLP